MEIMVLNSGKISNENAPIPNNITNGSSTIVWPIAICIPAFPPPRKPCVMFAANNGPGAITPDAEIRITVNTNSGIWFTVFLLLLIIL